MTIHTIPSLTSSDEIFYYLVPYNPTKSTLVYKFNTTDPTSTRTFDLTVYLEAATYSIAPDGTAYFFGGKHLRDAVFKVNFEAKSVHWEHVGYTLEPFRELPFSATVKS